MNLRPLLFGLACVACIAAGMLLLDLGERGKRDAASDWSEAEVKVLQSLWLESLPSPPSDPSNAVADDARAAALGAKLFYDTRFSSNGQVACVTCHLPTREFQDDLPLGEGVGTAARRTMPIAGAAYSAWLFWDGRADSLWAQALQPLESAVEHGGNRTQYAHLIARYYRGEYENLFGPLPALDDTARFPASAGPVEDPAGRAAWEAMAPDDKLAVSRVFANIGKSLAAYERVLALPTTRFDDYVAALLAGDRRGMRQALSDREVAGLRLFIGKAECTNCHNGPLLTNNSFHNNGVPEAAGLPPDRGRATGAPRARADPFNCLGPFSDAPPEECKNLRFLRVEGPALEYAFKPPTLRGVANRPPYMHAGQFATLAEVLAHYNQAPSAPRGRSELHHPLGLTDEEIGQLIAFLGALSEPGSPTPAAAPR